MFFSICSFAQITITDVNIASVGDVRIEKIDESPVGVSIGVSGGNQIWDFSSLNADYINELNFVAPGKTDFGATFPNSNLAIEIDDFYIFLSNNPNSLYLLGYAENTNSYPLENPELMLEFPTQYEDEFGFSIQLDSISLVSEMGPENASGLQFLMPGIVAAKIRIDTSSMSYVDGWGTAIVEGEEYDVLRVKNLSFGTDTVYGIVPQSHEVYASDYQIFTPDYLTINLFDTVHFSNLGMHNVVEVNEETWNANGSESNGGFEYYNDASHVFTEAGIYYYVCTPHIGNQMKGIVEVQENWDYIAAGVLSSGENSTSYTWYTDDATIGMPLVEMFLDSEGQIDEVSYIGNGEIFPSWNCIESACIDPEDGSGTYNSIESCEQECTINSIQKFEKNKIYPNPVNDLITFDVDNSGDLTIFGVDGKIVIKKHIKTTTKINISDLAKGIYHYQIISENNTLSGTFQIVK